MKKERILVVSKQPSTVAAWLTEWTKKYNIAVYSANSGISGLARFEELKPTLLVVDDNLPDMRGMSFTTTIKDGRHGKDTKVYLYNLSSIFRNAKADYFLIKASADEFREQLHAQITSYLNEKYMETLHSVEMQRAKRLQYEQLPSPVVTAHFHVNNIFSPMTELSGDGFDYWTGEDQNGLYGLLFDCTGHDIVSFSQCGAIRTLLKKACKLYQMGIDGYETLAKVMADVNTDTFSLNADPEPVSAIVFHFDSKKNLLRYCAAGIPGILYREKGSEQYQVKSISSFLIGYEENAVFEEEQLELTDIDSVIFSSDGFYELVFHDKEVSEAAIAKHDDVSAVIIELNRSQSGEEKGYEIHHC